MSRKWRKLLACSMLMLAIGLFTAINYRLWHLHMSHVPGGSYDDCCPDRRMIETKIFKVVNLPALVCVSPLRIPLYRFDVGGQDLYRGKGFGITYGDLVGFVAIFLFWWWVGKQIDEERWKLVSVQDRARPGRWIRRLYVLGISVCSIFLLLGVLGFTPLGGKFGLGPDIDAGHLYDVTFTAWGVILGTYFGVLLRATGSRTDSGS